MKTLLLAAAVLTPALASADNSKPYVLVNGRADSGSASAASGPTTSLGSRTASVNVAGGTAASSGPGSVRSFVGPRSSSHAGARRGVLGGAPAGGTGAGAGGATTGGSSTPAPTTEVGGWATPGAKILTAGQPPVYSKADGGGTNVINGGGFITIDQGRSQDVGKGPGIFWAPPDTPPGGNSGAGSGTGVTANGPAAGSVSSGAPGTVKNTANTAAIGAGYDSSF